MCLVDAPYANAFATGRNPSRAAVAVTTGLVGHLANVVARGGLLGHRDDEDQGSPAGGLLFLIVGPYVFDSYRATYRYGLLRSERLELDLGGTAFVRDAAISLQGVAVRAGYRVIEGGADSAAVYTFALLNHLGVGLSVRL